MESADRLPYRLIINGSDGAIYKQGGSTRFFCSVKSEYTQLHVSLWSTLSLCSGPPRNFQVAHCPSLFGCTNMVQRLPDLKQVTSSGNAFSTACARRTAPSTPTGTGTTRPEQQRARPDGPCWNGHTRLQRVTARGVLRRHRWGREVSEPRKRMADMTRRVERGPPSCEGRHGRELTVGRQEEQSQCNHDGFNARAILVRKPSWLHVCPCTGFEGVDLDFRRYRMDFLSCRALSQRPQKCDGRKHVVKSPHECYESKPTKRCAPLPARLTLGFDLQLPFRLLLSFGPSLYILLPCVCYSHRRGRSRTKQG